MPKITDGVRVAAVGMLLAREQLARSTLLLPVDKVFRLAVEIDCGTIDGAAALVELLVEHFAQSEAKIACGYYARDLVSVHGMRVRLDTEVGETVAPREVANP